MNPWDEIIARLAPVLADDPVVRQSQIVLGLAAHLPGLTRRPGALLAVLIEARGRALSYEEIEAAVWSGQNDRYEAKGSALRRVRAVLAAAGWPIRIRTITHLGLQAEIEDQAWRP